MTQEKADSIFNTSLGQQIDVIYVTSDDRMFIRWEEADKHRNGFLETDTKPLADQTITEWYPSDECFKQDAISITSVDNLALHKKEDGTNLADELKK